MTATLLAKISKFMGRAIVLTVFALMTILVAADQQLWSVSHSQRDSDNIWTTNRSLMLYDDGLIYYSESSSLPLYYSYSTLRQSPSLTTLFHNEDTLRVLWVGAGLLFICAVLLNLKFWELLIGIAGLIFGVTSIVMFAFGIGNAILGSDFDLALGIEGIGFSGTQYYEVPLSGNTVTIHFVKYGPQLGFWLMIVALALQTVAVSTRAYVVGEEVRLDRAHHSMDFEEADLPANESQAESSEKGD